MAIKKEIQELLKAETFLVKYSEEEECFLRIKTEDNVKEYSFSNKKAIRKGIKLFWHRVYKERLSDKQIDEILELLEMEAYQNPLEEQRAHRIYNEDDKLIIYQLNDKDSVWIDPDMNDGKPFIDGNPPFIFKTTANFQAQVYPDLSVKPKKFMRLVREAFQLQNKDDEKLFAIFLVTCFWGMSIHHPLYTICSEKGGGKSVLLKKAEMLVDPKKSGLCALPKSADGLSLRLANSYFTCFDNVSYLNTSNSDKLCMAITNACDTDRAMFKNTEERIVNLHSIVALTSIGMVVRASDLLDRTQLLRLKRLASTEIKTEREIWESYNKRLPQILGAIFNIIAKVIADDKPVSLERSIRLADYHELCVRIGRVIGISQEEITRLLFENKAELNKEAIDANITAVTLIEFMKNTDYYRGTPTDCLIELKRTARELGLDAHTLPKDAARLTTQLEKVKSELENTFGITFERERGKERRYVIRRMEALE